MSEILSDLVNNLGFYKMSWMINIYSRRCSFTPLLPPVTYPHLRLNWHKLQEHVDYSPWFSWRKNYCSIFVTKATVYPTSWSHNELRTIWCIVGQQTFCHKVVSFLFFFVWLVLCWRVKMTNTSSGSLKFFHIYRKWNGRRECKVLYEDEETV